MAGDAGRERAVGNATKGGLAPVGGGRGADVIDDATIMEETLNGKDSEEEDE